jgi:hypothetical protein
MGIKALILLNNDLTVTPASYPRTFSGPASPFCKAINAIAKMDGDEMFMTTGYHSIYSYLDLGDSNFSQNIISGFSKYKKANLRLLAGKYTDFAGKAKKNCINLTCTCTNCYPRKYKNFYQELKASLSSATSINIAPRIHERWHSKVTYKVAGSTFVALLMGSSNITTPALTRYQTSNTECDIFFYNENFDSIVQNDLQKEIGKTAFSFNLNGISKIGNIVKNSLDASQIFKFAVGDTDEINNVQNNSVLSIISETIKTVEHWYYQLATPLEVDINKGIEINKEDEISKEIEIDKDEKN